MLFILVGNANLFLHRSTAMDYYQKSAGPDFVDYDDDYSDEEKERIIAEIHKIFGKADDV